MDKAELKKWVQNMNQLGEEETPALKNLVAQYPYFQLGQMLYLKALHNQESYQFNSQLKIAAVHTLDRTRVYELIQGKVNIEVRKLNEAPIYKQNNALRADDALLPPEKPATKILESSERTPILPIDKTPEKKPDPIVEIKRPVVDQAGFNNIPRPQSKKTTEEEKGDLSRLSIDDIKERVKRILAEREQTNGVSLHKTLETPAPQDKDTEKAIPEQSFESKDLTIERPTNLTDDFSIITSDEKISGQSTPDVVNDFNAEQIENQTTAAEQAPIQSDDAIQNEKAREAIERIKALAKKENQKSEASEIKEKTADKTSELADIPLKKSQNTLENLKAQEAAPKKEEVRPIVVSKSIAEENEEGLSQAEIYRRKAQAIIEKSRQLKQKLEEENILSNSKDLATEEKVVVAEKTELIEDKTPAKEVPVNIEKAQEHSIQKEDEPEPIIEPQARIHFEIEELKEETKAELVQKIELIDNKKIEVDIEETTIESEVEFALETTEPEKTQKTIEEEIVEAKNSTIVQQAPSDVQGFLSWLKTVNKPQGNTRVEPKKVEKKATETTKKKEKAAIIDQFINENIQFKPEKKKIESAPMIDLAERYTDASSDLMTETLAQVYLEQGHKSKAIQAYEILKLKYPEKSSYFAARINKLKKDK